jgi:photosystem II stability/assembly factor-like uncharacterized protein
MKSILAAFTLVLIIGSCTPKKVRVTPYTFSYESSMRGLFNVDDNVSWASGTNGYTFISINNEWKGIQDTSLSSLDFRDIHSFSDKEAIIMSSGDGCKMYKTSDGAESWNLVYENNYEGIFFDGMGFWNDKNGIAFSDPIDNQLFIITTNDAGDSWQKLVSVNLPNTLKGEAGFAASGTGIVCVGDSSVYIGTGGGEASRVFTSHNRGKSWKAIETPMMNGEASGIYSMTFMDELNGVAVGGNYLDSANTKGNCVITSDGGLTWGLPKNPPTGYRSGVAHNGKGVLIATGRNGIDVSYDKGNNWKHITDDSYYSVVLNGNSGWLSGRSKMAKIIIE